MKTSKKTEDRLKNVGVDRILYYHKNSQIIKNICTVCLLLDKNRGVISRGVSVCSLVDTFKKIKGRGQSFSLALLAAETEQTSKQILNDRWEDEYIERRFKIKNERDEKEFDNLMSELDQLGVLDYISVMNDGTRKWYNYILPRNFPLNEVSKTFKHKSSFNPIPTKHEVRMLKGRDSQNVI